jgi:hypothetical protein
VTTGNVYIVADASACSLSAIRAYAGSGYSETAYDATMRELAQSGATEIGKIGPHETVSLEEAPMPGHGATVITDDGKVGFVCVEQVDRLKEQLP